MPLIPEGVIDEIQARADIAELIGRYVPLKRAGRHFKANCPFHKEKTPSFVVNTDKQIFHCFGCGVGGNIFTFLMQHDRLTFPEAVRQMAEQVGVNVPERQAGTDDGMHQRLMALMEKVAGYFERTLHSPQLGKSARAYLEQRGVSDSTRQTFRLGLAQAGWDHLLTAAKTTGVTPEHLEAAGFVIRGKSGYYDRFRNRLIFPIQDARGRVIGFGGRSLDDQEPKYLNSPETAIYSKGRHLFGLAQAKDAILKRKAAIVVEGYFDCIVLVGAGLAHVVSPLGTALTVEQAQLLKRYAERVILAFDADAAGETATLRGIDLLVETGLDVQVAQLPAGMDPDECVRAYGRERMEQMLEQGSLSIFEFLVGQARKRFPGTHSEHTVKAAQFVLPTIAKVPNAILRSEYVRQLAQRLQLDEAAVAQELAHAQPRSVQPSGSTVLRARSLTRSASIAQGSERLLTALVVDEPARWRQAQGLSLDDVTDPALRRVLALVCELNAGGQGASPAQVISRITEVADAALVTELVELVRSVASPEEAFQDCVRRLRHHARTRQREQLHQQLQAAQVAGAESEVERLLAEFQELVKGG